jgi:hypothetical protein
MLHKLAIVEYFDSLIADIDFITEVDLIEYQDNESTIELLNSKRDNTSKLQKKSRPSI